MFGAVLCRIRQVMAANPEGPESAPARGDHAAAIRRVGEALVGRYAEIGQATAARILDEIPGFRLAHSAIDAIDTITTQAAEAYLREETRLGTQSGRAARDLVERLINGQPIEPGRRHPAAPGLDPTGRLLTVVGRVEQTTLAVGDALQVARDALEESMSLGTVRPLATIRHGELVLISAGPSPRAKIASLRAARQRTVEEHNVDVRYGVSVPSQGLASVQQAYREAALSLSYT